VKQTGQGFVEVIHHSNKAKKNNPKEKKTMKKTLFILVLVLGAAGLMFAQTSDNHTVQVTAQGVQKIDVSNATVSFTMDAAVGDDYVMPAADATSTLSWSHNQGTNQEITVAAVKNVANPTNNITLQATYAGTGGATVTIVNAGTDASGVIKDNFGKGHEKNLGLSYEVMSATLAGTPAGAYSWTVTYTIQNNT
jgi:hypothetical protein